jgi:hypothetical protein
MLWHWWWPLKQPMDLDGGSMAVNGGCQQLCFPSSISCRKYFWPQPDMANAHGLIHSPRFIWSPPGSAIPIQPSLHLQPKVRHLPPVMWAGAIEHSLHPPSLMTSQLKVNSNGQRKSFKSIKQVSLMHASTWAVFLGLSRLPLKHEYQERPSQCKEIRHG